MENPNNHEMKKGPHRVPDDDCIAVETLLKSEFFGTPSRSTWRYAYLTGRIPKPVRIGRKSYYVGRALNAWVDSIYEAGEESRESFLAMRGAA